MKDYKQTSYWKNLQQRRIYCLNCMKHYKDLEQCALSEETKKIFHTYYMKHKKELRLLQAFCIDIQMDDYSKKDN